MIPLVLVPASEVLEDGKRMSAIPTNSNPSNTVNIPIHMCFFMTLPRKATDNKAVNIITAPETNKEICIQIMFK